MPVNRLKNAVKWNGDKWEFTRALALFNANIKIKSGYKSNGCDVINWFLKRGKLYNFFIMCFTHDYCLDELHYTRKKSREVMVSAGKEFGVNLFIRYALLSSVYIYDKLKGEK